MRLALTALTLLAGITSLATCAGVQAADKITPYSDGTVLHLYDKKRADLPSSSDLSMVVDLDERTLSIGTPQLRIMELTESRIEFAGYAAPAEKIFWSGSIDRLSGEANVSSKISEKPTLHYTLTCKPAKPLF